MSERPDQSGYIQLVDLGTGPSQQPPVDNDRDPFNDRGSSRATEPGDTRIPSGTTPEANATLAPAPADTTTEMPTPKGLSVSSHVGTSSRTKDAWSAASTKVRTYSDALIKRWNKEIDTYLVFAALFSAILTAFNIESYRLLRPEAPDPATLALERISFQLASFSVNPPFINSTHSAAVRDVRADADTVSPIPRWQIQLNTLWFSSLVLSLASASISIMVKQWLNEYNEGVFGTSRETARLRQHRLNNLRTWQVAAIVATIPILLQVALALFLAGILVLLWNLQRTVATAASVLASLLALFTIATIVLPLFKRNCPFVSPLTLALHLICRVVGPVALVLWSYLRSLYPGNGEKARTTDHWRIGPTWKALEQSAIRKDGIPKQLDIDVLVSAYHHTLSPDALANAATCLLSYEDSYVVGYYRKLYTTLEANYGYKGVRPPLGQGSFAWKGTHGVLWTRILTAIRTTKEDMKSQHFDLLWECCSLVTGFLPDMTFDEAAWTLSKCYDLMNAARVQSASSGEKFLPRADILYWMVLGLIEWDTERRRSHPEIHPQNGYTLWKRLKSRALYPADDMYEDDAPAWFLQLEDLATHLLLAHSCLRFATLEYADARWPPLDSNVADRIQRVMVNHLERLRYYSFRISPPEGGANVPAQTEKLQAVFRIIRKTLQDVLELVDSRFPDMIAEYSEIVISHLIPAFWTINQLLPRSQENLPALNLLRMIAYILWARSTTNDRPQSLEDPAPSTTEPPAPYTPAPPNAEQPPLGQPPAAGALEQPPQRPEA